MEEKLPGRDRRPHERDDGLARAIRSLGLEHVARLRPPVDRREVPRLFARYDCLANDTFAGAVDKVVLEAGAACVPAFASDPGHRELLADLGLQFRSGDADSLAERLRWFAWAPLAERERIGGALHDRGAAAHSVDDWARRLLEVVRAPAAPSRAGRAPAPARSGVTI